MLTGVIGLVAAAGPSAAMRTWMQAPEIRAELTNRKLAGIYPSQVAWSELIRADGTTDYEEGRERRPGRWSVEGELFCFVYALPQQGGCFRIVKHSPNCYELYTASIGGKAPMPPPPASNMSWNGRMWRDSERTTCEDKIVS
jgi:hypothetical protein